VTTQRIAIDGGSGREWQEMWLSDLRRIEHDGDAVVVQTVGAPPTRISAAPADYWVLLLRYAAFGEVPMAA